MNADNDDIRYDWFRGGEYTLVLFRSPRTRSLEPMFSYFITFQSNQNDDRARFNVCTRYKNTVWLYVF